ncbi:MAG: hypothetical protein ACREBE_16685, partial [bacterium]
RMGGRMVQGDVNGGVNGQGHGGVAGATRRSPEAVGDPTPLAGRWIAVGFAVLCLLTTLAMPDALFSVEQRTLIWPPDLRAWTDWMLQLHWLLGLLVFAPFAIMALLMFDLRSIRAARQFTVVPRMPSATTASGPHAASCRARWQEECDAIKTSWSYEKERISRLQCRLVLQGLLFGDLCTFALMCSALVAAAGGSHARIACSVAAAAATGFLTNLGRLLLRISGGDITTRTVSWAIRSQILVIIADAGLCMLLGDEAQNAERAVVIGLFVGATGSPAIQFMLEKASKLLNTGTVAAQRASPLLDIEGVTEEHVERLAEEGIVSIHDLAYVPTARLFFATTYSLPQICNWQDRALLQIGFGKAAADALRQKMCIRGAIDLMTLAHQLLFDEPTDTSVRGDLATALQVEPATLAMMLPVMAHDENAMRIRSFTSSIVAAKEDPAPPQIALGGRPPGGEDAATSTRKNGSPPRADHPSGPPPAA